MAKAYAAGTCMMYLWYKLLFNMTKVEYIQRGFCTDNNFLLLKLIPSAQALCSVAISILKHEVKIYLCTYVEIVLSQLGYYLHNL